MTSVKWTLVLLLINMLVSAYALEAILNSKPRKIVVRLVAASIILGCVVLVKVAVMMEG